MVRALYPRAAKIIAVSDGVADDLIKNFDIPTDRLVSIPNPVDVGAIQAKSREAPVVAINGPFI